MTRHYARAVLLTLHQLSATVMVSIHPRAAIVYSKESETPRWSSTIWQHECRLRGDRTEYLLWTEAVLILHAHRSPDLFREKPAGHVILQCGWQVIQLGGPKPRWFPSEGQVSPFPQYTFPSCLFLCVPAAWRRGAASLFSNSSVDFWPQFQALNPAAYTHLLSSRVFLTLCQLFQHGHSPAHNASKQKEMVVPVWCGRTWKTSKHCHSLPWRATQTWSGIRPGHSAAETDKNLSCGQIFQWLYWYQAKADPVQKFVSNIQLNLLRMCFSNSFLNSTPPPPTCPQYKLLMMGPVFMVRIKQEGLTVTVCPRLRHSLPARGQQQPAAMGHIWRQEAVRPEASQSHRGGPGQPAQRVATETALPVACGPALLHRVPRHQHELQPALQPHRPFRPGPGRTLGVLPASQEGTDGHITARWTHTRRK